MDIANHGRIHIVSMVVARPTSRPIYTTQQLTSCRQWQRHTMASFSVSYDVIYSSFHLSRGDTV